MKKRAYDRALEAFKAAVNADPGALDGYFNAGSVARHLRRCRDVLLYFRGFLYLSPGTEDDKTARAAIRECDRGPEVGRLSVRSEASGAEVFLDGVLVGRVPLNDLTVVPGDYRVEVRHPDYEPFAQAVKVASGETASVTAVLVMKPAFGYLQVVTVPADGVTVYLDDREVGVTPIETLKLKVGKVLVRFEKPGYDPWIRAVTIQKDRTYRLEATLEAASGTSETGGSPGGAAIPDGGR